MYTCFALCFQVNVSETLSCFYTYFKTPSKKIFDTFLSVCYFETSLQRMCFQIKFFKYVSKPSFYVLKPHFQRVLFWNILVYALKPLTFLSADHSKPRCMCAAFLSLSKCFSIIWLMLSPCYEIQIWIWMWVLLFNHSGHKLLFPTHCYL